MLENEAPSGTWQMFGDVELPTDTQMLSRAREVISEGANKNRAVGTAESCTGGMVASALTAVPGSSSVVMGGVVSYALSVKRGVLGVSGDTLDTPGIGAVSGECASQMCVGARRVLGCDVAVSITGIAGPGGAEPGKPVGTVWFGLAAPDGSVSALCRHFVGDRDAVRRKAVWVALGLLLDGVRA